MQTNDQLKLAADFVKYTNRNIFLTGKAGTGKTTFLKSIANLTSKRTVVIAPTGVAAINAAGVTIHSFFQLPFTPFIPSNSDRYDRPIPNKPASSQANFQKLNRRKINLIKGIDLLVIDEISMVRADVLDAIDETLRRYRDYSKPFGGVQLLMIGDLFQLAPVIKDDEWAILQEYYETVFFFSSKAIQKTTMVNIELKHIFRQSDEKFIALLNKVRDNKLDDETLEILNSRFQPNFNPDDKEGYIILTTHNATANNVNSNKLNNLKGKSYFLKAEIKDEFPPFQFPTDENLELKINAQVMFIKNDPASDKRYYNGKIGKIEKISQDEISVKCEGEEDPILVTKVDWENIRYNLNEETKEIKEEVIGVFTQFPLKLAWAITIHKSQGLTFEKAIIDANLSFAHGQVYVALSRCKSFEGMVLRSKISSQSIKTDFSINSYTEQAKTDEPNEKTLDDSKHSYQKSQMDDLFSFFKLNYRINHLLKIANENKNLINQKSLDEINLLQTNFLKDIFSVSEKFKLQLKSLDSQDILPEDNSPMQERIKKASAYFVEKIENIVLAFTYSFTFDLDNKVLKKQVTESLEAIQNESIIKFKAMKSALNGFNTMQYIKDISNADIDFVPKIKQNVSSSPIGLGKMPRIYYDLKMWRNSKAYDYNANEFMILPQKTMVEIVEKLPITESDLKKIKGLGKQKISLFGDEIIDLVKEYRLEIGMENTVVEITQKSIIRKPEKIDTKRISFDLFKSGTGILEIAKQRNLAVSTIEGHLAHYIKNKELDINDVLDGNVIAEIYKVINENEKLSVSELKAILGDKYSYSEIRLVVSSITE